MNDEENIQPEERPVDERLQTPQSEAVNWRFTINFAGDDGMATRDQRITSLRDELLRLHEAGEVVYAVLGREVGESGTPHIQGHVRFKKKKRFARVKTIIDQRAWLATASKPSASIKYCKKDGNFVEIGQEPRSNQGHRKDLEEAKQTMDTGCSLKDFQEQHFGVYMKYGRNAEAYLRSHAPKRTFGEDGLQVHWYWGAAGTGKTYKVHLLEDAFENPDNLWIAFDNKMKWFDGYDGQPAVLFDDFDHIDPEFLDNFKKCTDKYGYRFQSKGSTIQWRPQRIYFTSNRDLEDVINELREEHQGAIRRRFTKIVHFTDLMHK